jgi:hypothetical protein
MDFFHKVNSKSNIGGDILSNKSIIDELQDDILTQIYERGAILPMPKYNPIYEFSINISSEQFYDPKRFFGILNTNKNNEFYIYSLVIGEGDTNNNLFYIKDNIVYSKKMNGFVLTTVKSIRVRATDSNGQISENAFKIYPYTGTALSQIITCLSGTKKIIDFITVSSLLIQIDIQPKYGQLIEIGPNVYEYYTTNPATNDYFTFHVNIEDFKINTGACLIEIFDDLRIDSLPKSIGNYTFDRYSYNGFIWNVGTFTGTNFYLFNEDIVIGNLTLYKI